MSKRKKKNKKPKKESMPMELKLHIQEMVFQKVMHWVDKCPQEISGMGIIEIIDGIPTVTDAFLFKQKNTSTSTDLDGHDINALLYELHVKGVKSDLRWWWHSHVNMGVFWSATDQSTIQEIGSQGWITASVFNKKREVKSAIYTAEPFNIYMPDVPTTVITQIPQALINEWDKSYNEKVVIEPPKQYSLYEGRRYIEGYGSSDKEEVSGNQSKRLSAVTDKEQEQIEELRAQGFPEDQIASAIGLDEKPYINEDDVEEIISVIDSLNRSGLDPVEIESELIEMRYNYDDIEEGYKRWVQEVETTAEVVHA